MPADAWLLHIASADRWALVIRRGLLTGKSRYSDFLALPIRITTNILADWLEKMETARLFADG